MTPTEFAKMCHSDFSGGPGRPEDGIDRAYKAIDEASKALFESDHANSSFASEHQREMYLHQFQMGYRAACSAEHHALMARLSENDQRRRQRETRRLTSIPR